MQPGRARTSGLGITLLPLARWVGWVVPVRPTHGMLVLSCPSAALRVCGVLGHLAPVHRCARWVCCVACAVSWVTWFPFTGALAQCVALRVRCPGPLGSCSPVSQLGVLCCVCGVLGHLAPVHRCARQVCCVAFTVSRATWLPFTGVPAGCVVLPVRCPGSPGSRSPVRSLSVLLCVCGVLGHVAPVHRCPPSVCCVACVVSWATWLLFTAVPAWFVVLRVRCPGPLGRAPHDSPVTTAHSEVTEGGFAGQLGPPGERSTGRPSPPPTPGRHFSPDRTRAPEGSGPATRREPERSTAGRRPEREQGGRGATPPPPRPTTSPRAAGAPAPSPRGRGDGPSSPERGAGV